jgi:hypothetical protein
LADEFPSSFHLLGGEGKCKKQKWNKKEFFHGGLGNWRWKMEIEKDSTKNQALFF